MERRESAPRSWSQPSPGAEVVLISVIDGGRTNPSIEGRLQDPVLQRVGTQNADIEMAAAVWAFFEGKTR
jgi:hypothetical protein